jgi:cyclic pyranopterin phosphate synthase
MELRLTTNATLLAQYINGLRDLGIQAMNVSLDTLRQKRFYNITGRDLWPVVMSNIEKLIKCGFKLKINAVAMRGVNSDELPDFIALARQNPVDVRFIEIMPIGKDGLWSKDMFWSANDILREAETLADLSPQKIADRHAGPARMYSINGGAGRIGLISPLSGHFCMGCNRLRISADGRLRTCLFSDRQYRLRGILRHAGLGEKAARRVIAAANNKKPIGRDIFDAQGGPTQRMTAIGG